MFSVWKTRSYCTILHRQQNSIGVSSLSVATQKTVEEDVLTINVREHKVDE